MQTLQARRGPAAPRRVRGRFGAARCAQRRKTANAHFEPLAVEFPRSFLARGGSTRYGREHAPPMNICWAVVVVNQPRTGGRRFPQTTVDNKVRS